MKLRLDWIPSPEDPRDLTFSQMALQPTDVLPNKVNLLRTLPPAVSQGGLGSCTACAVAMMQSSLLHLSPRSRLQIYYLGRKMHGWEKEDSGLYVRSAMQVLKKHGATQESNWPYDEDKFDEEPDESAMDEAREHRIGSFYRVNGPVEYRQTLAAGYTFVIGIYLSESADEELAEETGVWMMPGSKEKEIGGHAMLIAGYDNDFRNSDWAREAMSKGAKVPNRVYYARNSWGPDWGRRGNVAIDARIIDNPLLATDAWTARV